MARDGDLEIVMESRNVERLFFKMMVATSPLGMGAFLDHTIDPIIRGRIRDRFRSEGDDASGKWAPLSRATVEIREGLGYPGEHPINKRTGDLERFLTKVDGDVDVNPGWATLTLPGTNPSGEMLKKLTKAQTGKDAKGKQGLARPILALDTNDLALTMAALRGYIEVAGR